MHSNTVLTANLQSLIKTATQKYQQGQLEDAEFLYRKLLEAQSQSTTTHSEFANIHHLILTDFGNVLQKQSKLEEAVQQYQQAVQLKPDFVQAQYNLANVLRLQGKSRAAIGAYQKTLKLKPDFAIAYFYLANLFKEAGKIPEAITAYQTGIKHNPNVAAAHNNLGNILKDLGKVDLALACYKYAIKLNPNYAETYNNIGNILKDQGQLEQGIEFYQKAIEIAPNLAQAYRNLGTAFRRQGQLEQAIEAYQQALKIDPTLAEAAIGICISQLPIIYATTEEIITRREAYQLHLQQLAEYYKNVDQKQKINAAQAVGTLQPFYLSYQGLNDRPLQQIYGEMIHQLMACRYPQYTQPLSLPKLQPNEKIRVGFVSGFFRSHSNWKIPIKGWVENLNREQFQLYGYHTSARQDQYTQEAQNAFEQFIQGPLPLSQWCEQIKADNLHVLIFPEFGMDPTTIQLGCLRLAPIQMSSWGHPETSGLPTIDYYLSSELMEPEIAEDCYSETLIKLPNLSIHYTPLEIPPQQKTKAELGMKEEDIFFWCCQSLYKYLPQHDDVFSQIAQQVKKSKFVFIKHIGDNSEQITTVFTQRLEKAFAESGLNYQDYCLFLPRLKSDEFAGVTAIADIFLDSMGWSGCNSSLEAIAQNLPIITLPGELMRGRHTAAILRMMGLTETIASDKQQYIQLAVKLATDKNYRQGLRQSIEENKHKLYQDLAPVRALENFLFSVVHSKV
jgi:protein O-GlcNAc transferase